MFLGLAILAGIVSLVLGLILVQFIRRFHQIIMFYLGGLFFQKGNVVKSQGQQMMDGRLQFSRACLTT
jgi:hypothetical protein